MTAAAITLLVGSAANAAELLTDDSTDVFIATPSGSAAPVSITQNNDTTTIDQAVSVACGVAGDHTADNHYLRRFFLNGDHGIVDQFTVESVDFGVSQVETPSGLPVATIVTMNIYSIANGDAFTFANMTLEDSAPIEVTTADVGSILNVAVGGVFADPVGTDLVVDLFSPDLTADAIQFRAGANGNGSTRDAYIASDACGISEPTGISAIGFPTSQYIFVVHGDEAGTVPTEDATWSEVKSLF
jgi:hypothetical protein